MKPLSPPPSLSRLSDNGADPFEAALLRSARGDGASGRRDRTLAALAIAGAATAGVATAGVAGSASLKPAILGAGRRLAWLKGMTLVGIVAVVGVAGLAAFRDRARPAATDQGASVPPARAGDRPATRPADEPGAAALLADRPTTAPAPPTDIVRPARAVTRTTPRAAQTRPSAPIDSLPEEVSILDRCRLQLSQGDGAGAAQTAEAYLARFPTGRLAREAEVVRIRAALLTGGPTAAAPLAAAFLRAHPDSPHAPALRKLLR